ncbi:putative general substrate transporter protein [Eutypa lata UCREL1]|uniref:Putative general substrate transporter protein n=1 Tax=Eutypa lata (strain UCR-EL1) TaxID=1287681 RepID=M7TN79_EUTLA|nr:putative general substrate transporter protein [Eutypa lata UCREL1]
MAKVDRLPETSLWTNWKCLLICAAVAVANMQYGLDSAVMASLQAMPGFLAVFGYEDPSQPGGYAIEGTFQQLIGSLLTLGAFVSSLVAGAFARFFGRRIALWLACILNVVACAIQIGTDNKIAVYIGRFILGLANGFLVTFSNIYTAEAAPAHLRAVMVAMFSEWVNIGSIMGASVTNATKSRMERSSYQIPLATLFIVPAILVIVLFFVPESPRYLLYRGNEEAARNALEALRGNSLKPEELELEWVEMVKGIEEEKRTASAVGPLDMFRVTVAGVSVDDAFKFSVMNTCLGLIGVNIGIYLMRHVMGRRTILMTGAVVQGFVMLGLAVSATVAPGTEAARKCVIAFTGLYICSYNMLVGDATYPTATEMVSTRLRSWSVGSAISLGYFLAWLTGFCSPYFINPENLNWGAKYGYIWAGSNFCCLVFFYLFVPETKGRTLEEIDELFANRVSVRNFKSFKTAIMEDALRDVNKGREDDVSTPQVREVEHSVAGDKA